MKYILLSLSILGICVSSQGQVARQHSDPNTGHFDIIQNTVKGEEHINVNYALYPAPFISTLKLNLNTPDPMMLSVKVVNQNNDILMQWMPSEKSNRYNHDFDISNLQEGNYSLLVYGPDGKLVQTIRFTHQAATSSNTSQYNSNSK